MSGQLQQIDVVPTNSTNQDLTLTNQIESAFVGNPTIIIILVTIGLLLLTQMKKK